MAECEVYDWKKLKKTTGGLEARARHGGRQSYKMKDIEGFKEFFKKNTDKSTRELANIWYEKVSSKTILRQIKKLGYTYKKKRFIIQKEAMN